ncbi:MAG TPA: hypothetical protein VHY36_14640 [Steroidobacteraceae bacterium]|jgi:hypothetical protein|nr:hypothetical protein [Steroidobacteraceae bacterium]
MDPRLVTPYLITAIVVWAVYRRMRRSFGRQRVQEKRMWIRIGFLTLAAALIVTSVVRNIDVLGALAAGIACGAALGFAGLKYTKFEITPEGRFYTPHAYIGLVVTALFLGRLLYRFLEVYNGVTPAAAAGQSLAATYQHSPFLLAVFGVLVGYYVLYYLGVLQRTKPAASLDQQTGATGQ